jgi:hypothetical protein
MSLWPCRLSAALRLRESRLIAGGQAPRVAAPAAAAPRLLLLLLRRVTCAPGGCRRGAWAARGCGGP